MVLQGGWVNTKQAQRKTLLGKDNIEKSPWSSEEYREEA